MNVSLVDIPKTLNKCEDRMLELIKENETKNQMERESFYLVKLLNILYSGDGIKKINLNKHQNEVGEEVAKRNVVPILMRFMNLLTQNGATYPEPDKADGEYFRAIRSIFWNYSDKSVEFCQTCVNSGLIELLSNDIEKLKLTFKNNSSHGQIVYEAFSILHNCAKAGIERSEFSKVKGLCDLAEYYWKNTYGYKLNNDDGPYFVCTFFYAAIADESKLNGFVIEDDVVVEKCIEVVEKAMDRPERSYDGYSISEVIYGLTVIARNLENRKRIAKNKNILEILGSLTDDEQVCGIAIEAITILMDLPAEENTTVDKLDENEGKGVVAVEKNSTDEIMLIQSTSELPLDQQPNKLSVENTPNESKQSPAQATDPSKKENLEKIITPGVGRESEFYEEDLD